MQGGWAAKNSSTFARTRRLRNTTRPDASAPCAWRTRFAMSNPIVLACPTDASSSGRSTPPPWHADAVRGRPPHHGPKGHQLKSDLAERSHMLQPLACRSPNLVGHQHGKGHVIEQIAGCTAEDHLPQPALG